MKKFLLSFIVSTCLVFCVGIVSTKAMTCIGTCGVGVDYALDTETGVLTIEGTGPMRDFSYNSVPWYNYRDYIETIVIEDGVTTIGQSAFYNCMKLSSVEIAESVTSIGNDAFEYCKNLTSITIPDGVTTINSYAFLYCENLTTVNIGKSVKTIGYMAFGDCSGLKEVIIPKSVTKIDATAFSGCSSLTYAFYEGSKESLYIGNNSCLSDILTYGEGLCGKNLSWIFYPETGTLTISGTGTMYNYNYNTAPWYNNRNYIKKVIVEKGVTNIGKYSFNDCSNLSLALFEGEEAELSIGLYNTSFTDVLICCEGMCGDNVRWDLDIETGILTISGSGKMKNYSYDYSYPDRAPWYEIKDYITSVEINDGVTSIGSRAFEECGYLKDITIPKSITEINEYAFDECNMLSHAYYAGSEAEWAEVYISRSCNTDLTYYASIHYTEESIIPDTEGKTPEIGQTSFTFIPVGVSEGDIIAVVVVKDGVSTAQAKTYSGSGTVTFEIEDGFNSIKILVWDSYESMEPLMKEYATIE